MKPTPRKTKPKVTYPQRPGALGQDKEIDNRAIYSVLPRINTGVKLNAFACNKIVNNILGIVQYGVNIVIMSEGFLMMPTFCIAKNNGRSFFKVKILLEGNSQHKGRK